MLKSLVDGFRSLVPGGKSKDRKEAPGLFDRREQVRLKCHYQVECKLHHEGFNAVALDLGTTGVRLGVTRKLEKDGEVFLSYRPGGKPVGRQRLKCRVVWCHPDETHGFLCGLAFNDTPENVQHSWAMRVLDELGFDPRTVIRRKAMRANSSLPVQLQDLDTQKELSGTIGNIGVGGALVTCETAIEVNARLQLHIGPLDRMKPLSLLGRVLSCKQSKDETCWMIGVRFLNHQNTPEIELLGKYVIRLLKDAMP